MEEEYDDQRAVVDAEGFGDAAGGYPFGECREGLGWWWWWLCGTEVTESCLFVCYIKCVGFFKCSDAFYRN